MVLKLGKRKNYGFSLIKFAQSDSYLRRYLIDIANFAENEKNINATEQKILLVIYFYSLFFESLMSEKPIICFVGLKDSGKSTIGSLIGKILFGDKFQCRHFPEDVKDLQTIIGENYFMVLDNVDRFVNYKLMDALCAAATGATIEKRKLYTDCDIVKIWPHIFLGITTREAKFKRDDLISRLLLFNTEKITKRIQKEKFYRDIEENRNKIMTEVLVNLNSIIVLLKRQEDFSPVCTFRVADWETFGRKITVGLPWGFYFKFIIDLMNEEKDKFALEDDPLFFLLKKRVIDDKRAIKEKSAHELYTLLEKDAADLKMKDFTYKRYKSPISIGKRIKNTQDELRRVFDVEIRKAAGNVTLYSFDRLEETKIEQKEREDQEIKKRKEQEEIERKKSEEECQRREEERQEWEEKYRKKEAEEAEAKREEEQIREKMTPEELEKAEEKKRKASEELKKKQKLKLNILL